MLFPQWVEAIPIEQQLLRILRWPAYWFLNLEAFEVQDIIESLGSLYPRRFWGADVFQITATGRAGLLSPTLAPQERIP